MKYITTIKEIYLKLTLQFFKWVVLSFFSLIITILAYPIVPIAVLFRKDGKLPKIFYWFETYDNPVEGELAHWERWESFRNKYGKFGLYCQCVGWLWRNKGYNFAYHVCGINVDNTRNEIKFKGDTQVESGSPVYHYGYLWATCESGWSLFAFIPHLKIGNTQYCLRVYLGWKFKGRIDNDQKKVTHHMLACHINPFRKRILK